MTAACLPGQATICTIKPPGPPACTCVGVPAPPIVCQSPATPVNGRCVTECTVAIKYTHPLHPEVTTNGYCDGSVELALAVILARFLGAP